MRSLVIAFVLAACLATPAWAQSVSFGSKLINVGDTVGTVQQVAGKPDRIVPIQNKYGATVAERFEYYLPRKSVLITVKEGKVTEIREVF